MDGVAFPTGKMRGLGLVSYASSDEEDETPSQQTISVPARNNVVTSEDANSSKVTESQTTASAGNEVAFNGMAEEGPMVGPTMYRNLQDDGDLDQEDSLDESPRQMSERETIHYLTQTTHPMTSIPPSPPGSPDPALNAKFKRFLELKTKGVHFNMDLANKSAFRNPGLLATMMMRAGLEEEDQYRTSLPLETFDPTGFPTSAYKEELLRSQQSLKEQDLAAKKSLSAAGKRTIEFTSGGASGASSRESTPGTQIKRKRP